MSQQNSEIVVQLIDATNRRALNAFVARVSQDVEWEDSVFWSEPERVFRGRAELRGGSTKASLNPGRASISRSRRSPKLGMIGSSTGAP